ncbi:MAG TPA: glycosyltransferase family 2 protein [Kiritimatiellia bacterium]|nr:glycosyltransferase family 2 protein [Kiritimatiellia bacterium]
MTSKPPPIDIVVPVFNEPFETVRDTISAILKSFEGRPDTTLIVVDDGSDPSYQLDQLQDQPGLVLVRHARNSGYGSALKSGIRRGTAEWIAIADADGTYPVAELPAMVDRMADADMVLGERTGDIKEIPHLRRFPKMLLNRFASYMAGVHIADLNTGMRVFRRDLCYGLWGLLPRQFSFTSTLTMGAHMAGLRVLSHRIDYYKRVGSSSIHPIRDTIRFFALVLRLGMLFTPMKVFGPVALLLFGVGAIKGIGIDFHHLGAVGNMSVMLMVSGVQVFLMGLLAEMIVHNRDMRLRAHPAP